MDFVSQAPRGLATLNAGAAEGSRVNGVAAYTNDIDKGLEACHDKLSTVVARLEPILRPAPPSPSSANAQPVRSMESPLAERQVAHKAALGVLYERLDDLLARIDL